MCGILDVLKAVMILKHGLFLAVILSEKVRYMAVTPVGGLPMLPMSCMHSCTPIRCSSRLEHSRNKKALAECELELRREKVLQSAR